MPWGFLHWIINNVGIDRVIKRPFGEASVSLPPLLVTTRCTARGEAGAGEEMITTHTRQALSPMGKRQTGNPSVLRLASPASLTAPKTPHWSVSRKPNSDSSFMPTKGRGFPKHQTHRCKLGTFSHSSPHLEEKKG